MAVASVSGITGVGRVKRGLKDRGREAIQRAARSRSPVAACLLGGLELAGRLPWVGPTCRRWAGLIHATQGRHARAITRYRSALHGGLTGHPSLHYDLGQSLLETGEAGLAEAEFRTALRLVPDAIWPVYGLVQSLARQGRESECVPELLEAARSLPARHVRNLPFPHYLAPQVLAGGGDLPALRNLVAAHPEAAKAATLLGHVESLRGDAEAAASLFRSAGAIEFRGREQPWARVARPTFLLVGQAKAGTSALFQYLAAHPSIVPPLMKEPHYFSIHHSLGPEWYASLFPRLAESSGLVTGEGSTSYLIDPDAPRRVAEELPGARLIVLLREPVSRAYSEYWMHVRLGQQNASFEDLVAAEMALTPSCPLDESPTGNGPSPGGYLARGAALVHLKRWLEHVSPDRLLVLRDGQLARDLPEAMHRVCRFIGVPPFVPADRRRHNEGRYPPLSDDLRGRLREWFEPHERALGDLLAGLPQVRS